MKTLFPNLIFRLNILVLSLVFVSAPLFAQVSETTAELNGSNQGNSLSQLKGEKSRRTLHTIPSHSLPAVGNNQDGYPPLVLGLGDLISISVYGDEEVPMEFQLDTKGCIIFPYIGKINLSGLTPIQAGDKIGHLSGKANNVSILVEESNTFYVSVIGSVPRPGKIQIRGIPTVLSALAEAGGGLPESDLGGSLILHNNIRTKVDLNHYLEGQGTSPQQPYLYPGDILVVPKAGFPSSPGDFAVITGIFASLAVAVYYMNQAHVLNF
jgi:polysaccharide biosynthesis/export protein VpsN